MHEADLLNSYGTGGQQLDIVELAAVYASMPEKFNNDAMKKKINAVRKMEENLQGMMLLKAKNRLSKALDRNVAYKGQNPGCLNEIGFAKDNMVSYLDSDAESNLKPENTKGIKKRASNFAIENIYQPNDQFEF